MRFNLGILVGRRFARSGVAASLRVLGICVALCAAASAVDAATLSLAWDASSDPNVTGYNIYWGQQSGVYTMALNVGRQNSTQVAGLLDGTTYYFVVRAYNSSGSVSPSSGEVSAHTSATGVWIPTFGDFRSDGKSEMTVFRPSTGTWYVGSPAGAVLSFQWGMAGDVPVAGDYDGDGQADLAVFRPSNGTWYIRYTASGLTTGVQWGMAGRHPCSGRLRR